jgi:hypothetical protein
MHDGDQVHFSRAVRNVLNNTCHDRWIGTKRPTAWPPPSPDFNSLDFYMWGHLKPLWTQLVLKTKRHFTIALWMPVRLLPATPPSLNGCGGPWWYVSRRALKLMEGILSAYYKFTLSAVTRKLNVSGHMLVWAFFLVLIRGTRAQLPEEQFSLCLLCSHVIQNTRHLEEYVTEGAQAINNSRKPTFLLVI